MIKEVRIPVGGLLEVVPTFGSRLYITSSGKVFTNLEEAKKEETYFDLTPVKDKDYKAEVFPDTHYI